MPRALRHHIVPRFFLARFADERPMLLVDDLKEARAFEASPRRVMSEIDYYTVETETGPSDAIEQALGALEGATAAALREIDAGAFPPSDSARGAIASFMAMQSVRGRDFRSMGDRLATETTRMMGKLAAAHPDYIRHRLPKALGREVTEDEVQGVIETLNRGAATVTVSREQHIRTMLYVADAMVPAFLLRQWFLIEAEHLPTTDMPVVLWKRPQEGFFGQGIGVVNAEEIAMAVSPTRALVLVHSDELSGRKLGSERAVTLKKERERQLRQRLWHHALRYRFRHPGSPAPE